MHSHLPQTSRRVILLEALSVDLSSNTLKVGLPSFKSLLFDIRPVAFVPEGLRSRSA
jgi:hypothetical protein